MQVEVQVYNFFFFFSSAAILEQPPALHSTWDPSIKFIHSFISRKKLEGTAPLIKTLLKPWRDRTKSVLAGGRERGEAA